MTTDKNTGPGAEALCKLDDAKLKAAVEGYEAQVAKLPKRSEAHRIMKGLIEVGRGEIEERAGKAGNG